MRKENRYVYSLFKGILVCTKQILFYNEKVIIYRCFDDFFILN